MDTRSENMERISERELTDEYMDIAQLTIHLTKALESLEKTINLHCNLLLRNSITQNQTRMRTNSVISTMENMIINDSALGKSKDMKVRKTWSSCDCHQRLLCWFYQGRSENNLMCGLLLTYCYYLKLYTNQICLDAFLMPESVKLPTKYLFIEPMHFSTVWFWLLILYQLNSIFGYLSINRDFLKNHLQITDYFISYHHKRKIQISITNHNSFPHMTQ